MNAKSEQSFAFFEAGEGDLVSGNDGEASKCDRQCVPMKWRDAEQDQPEKDNIANKRTGSVNSASTSKYRVLQNFTSGNYPQSFHVGPNRTYELPRIQHR
jgi:hypothetical protein